MNIKVSDTVKVKREIKRIDSLDRAAGFKVCFKVYAQAGDKGTVEESFYAQGTWYAKVRMGNELKTFRLTSLEVIK